MWKDNDWSMIGCKDFWEKDAEKQREKERLRMKKNIMRFDGSFTLDEPHIEKKLDAKTCEAIVENFNLALKQFVESNIGFTNGGRVKKNDND